MSEIQTTTPVGRERHPFGNPDGARANLQEVMQKFVGIDDDSADLADPAADLSARIIVGRMGAGKTLYLRRSQAFASADQSMYADHVRNDLPTTEDVIDVCHREKPHLVTETWTSIWRAAILRALGSHLLFAHQLRTTTAIEARERLEDDYAALLGRPAAPRSPYAEVTAIVRSHQNRTALSRYLKNPRWPDLTYHLAATLRDAPPVYFFLDAIDEQFGHAPMYWLKFQKGLFHAVMDLLRAPEFGGRLHVVACVRDIVYSNVLRSEHAGRYRDEPHIRVLDWDAATIRQLLHAKIGKLGSAHRMDPSGSGVKAWLGVSEIENVARQVNEPVEEYLLRHTRLLPRDVVTIGNSLSREVAAAKDRDESALDATTIRRVVDRAAAGFADMQLRVCANQIAADMMPANAVTHGYANVYLGDTEYARGISEDLRAVLAAVERDRFDGLALERAREVAATRFKDHVRPESDLDPGLHVLDVLWQHGLVGYQTSDDGEVRFAASAEFTDFHLPMDRRRYALHPCVAHAVAVEPVGPPVSMV